VPVWSESEIETYPGIDFNFFDLHFEVPNYPKFRDGGGALLAICLQPRVGEVRVAKFNGGFVVVNLGGAMVEFGQERPVGSLLQFSGNLAVFSRKRPLDRRHPIPSPDRLHCSDRSRSGQRDVRQVPANSGRSR
jgi:hypothetical protein